jgi:tetratricopeptide (TPR) repeat protein
MRHTKRKIVHRLLACALLSISPLLPLSAQEHIVHRENEKTANLAEQQYLQGHYKLALQSAREYLKDAGTRKGNFYQETAEKAAYYSVLSQLKLGTETAADSATMFLATTANPVYRQRTSFSIAQYYFKHEQLQKAITWYESADISNLSNQEIADSKFELAYCYFNSRQFDKAAPLFASIKEVQGKYYLSGNYYHGLLAYNDGDYPEALQSFQRIENEKQYRTIVPYYIAEIHYFKGDKEKALADAKRLIGRDEKLYYDNELHLLAAQVLFEDQKYKEAIPFFEHYYDNTDKIRKEELYEMGYSYYRVKDWENAKETFKYLSNTMDSLGQTAMYLLGDCYLNTRDKKSARNAFGLCADMPYNKGQQEAAILLYGKLSYEMGYNDAASGSFARLITEFPNSAYLDEARTLWSDLMMRTNNYAQAYTALSQVSNKDKMYWRIHQKVSYGYAMQQAQADNLAYADTLLSESLQQPDDNSYEAAALFWKGDIAYKLGKRNEAIVYLGRFVKEPANNRLAAGVSPRANFQHAYLDLGYVSMDLNEYPNAQEYFANAKTGDDPSIGQHASLREADAVFMQKNYAQASAMYDKLIASSGNEADYAKLQKAILLGIQRKTHDKVSLLQQLLQKTPPSEYARDARYELGITYVEDDKYQQAINVLQPLTEGEGSKGFASRSLLKTAFSYQQLNNNAKAIETYKMIVTGHPASEERTAALDALKSLYIETNQPDAYSQLLKDANLPAEDMAALDSAFYESAEAQFAGGKWATARTAFNQYLSKYPNGAFSTQAWYYKAESHQKLGESKEAIAAYDSVLTTPWNPFSENSALRAASIAWQAQDYPAASRYYGLLRNVAIDKDKLQTAYSGMMKSAYNNGGFEEAARYADTLLSLPELDTGIRDDISFLKAKSLLKQGKNAEALAIFKELEHAANADIGSEARYRIAEYYYQQNDLKEAEASAANAIKQSGGNDYWLVKSYLLISDILVKQNDYFNAKATLQSVVKNTKNAELKKEAARKLEEVKTLEKKQSKLTEE